MLTASANAPADLAAHLEQALLAAASPALAHSLQRYFPAPVALLGVSNSAVGALAALAWRSHRALPAADWRALADHFAHTHAYHEHLILASALAAKLANGDDDDCLFALIGSWLLKDVSNWAQCDDLCIKPLYRILQRQPHLLAQVTRWGTSPSPWCRRASNVALVKLVGRSDAVDIDAVLANCARLLADPHPYVQKGVGWVLKVASQYQMAPVLAFLQDHAALMMRPTLRYALEKLPPETRRAFMRNQQAGD